MGVVQKGAFTLCCLVVVGYSAHRDRWCMVLFTQFKRIKTHKMLLACGLALMLFCAASCSAASVSVKATPTAITRVEVLVASTFTPAPTEQLESIYVEPTPIEMSRSIPLLTTVTPAGANRKPLETHAQYAEYTVTAGDTLINLALHYDVPMAAIQLASDLGDTTGLRVGQVLNIPQAADWIGASPYWAVYVVQAGETVSEIAAAYGLSVMHVVEANVFAEADMIKVGQKIILPLEGPAEIEAAAQAPLPSPEQPTATPFPPTPAPTIGITATPASPDPTDTPIPQPAPDLSGDTAAMRTEIFRLINEQRAIYNLAPLAWNDTLAHAAQKHADDCYQRGWCGHTGSDGSTMKARIIREGYDPIRWSECWAWYGTPALAVVMWMDEVPPDDAHRRTILSTYLTEVGVGVVPGNGHGYYFIADFGTPRE